MATKQIDALKVEALNQAIAYHRSFDNGMATALAHKGKPIEGPKPGCVVETAKVFHTFLSGK
jgi:hypothetical protein